MIDPTTFVRDAVNAEIKKAKRKPKMDRLNAILTAAMKQHLSNALYWEDECKRARKDYAKALDDLYSTLRAPLWKFAYYKALIYLGVDRYEARDYLQAKQGDPDAQEITDYFLGRYSTAGKGGVVGLLYLLPRLVHRFGSQGFQAEPKSQENCD